MAFRELHYKLSGRSGFGIQKIWGDKWESNHLTFQGFEFFFFLNGKRVSKDPESASIINVGEQLQGCPSERGELQHGPVKVQKGPWRKLRKAIRSFRRPPRRRRRNCMPRPPRHHRGTATWGDTASRSRGHREAAEQMPYTYPVRTGGTEQAAPCRPEKSSW
jgi:hypothetical protein